MLNSLALAAGLIQIGGLLPYKDFFIWIASCAVAFAGYFAYMWWVHYPRNGALEKREWTALVPAADWRVSTIIAAPVAASGLLFAVSLIAPESVHQAAWTLPFLSTQVAYYLSGLLFHRKR